MKYRYMQSREDYSDYASGKIFYGAPGSPSLPVRLGSEIFHRCVELRKKMGMSGPCTLYDPCCGGAYLLSTITYFNWDNIQQVIGSDIDETALAIAIRNLALLSLDGLDKRIAEIIELKIAYGKTSHIDALKSGQALRRRLLRLLQMHLIKTYLFRADATDGAALSQNLGDTKIDIVITDTPYGQHSAWRFDRTERKLAANPIQALLESLLSVLADGSIVAIVTRKQFGISHSSYRQVGRLKLGKRQVAFLLPIF